jgi:NAD(P)H-dependent FMN reductase
VASTSSRRRPWDYWSSPGGGFPTPALEHLRSVARALDAWVLPHQVAIPKAHGAFEHGGLIDEGLAERIETLGTELVDYAGVESYPETTVARAVPTAD